MTTRTDFQSIRELRNAYTPETLGIVTKDEQNKIRRILELETRSGIELCNVRDMTVMLYSEWGDAEIDKLTENSTNEEREKAYQLHDAMSAICSVIDDEKWKRGIEP